MLTGWRYRLVSVAGVVTLVVSALVVANHLATQQLFTSIVPLFNRLDPTVLSGASFWWALLLSVLFVAGSLWPLYKPQPSRLLDIVFVAQKRVILGGLALATLGFFKWSHRLPRATLTILIGLLVFTVPLWFILIRHRPSSTAGRTLIVGDDLEQIRQVTATVDGPVEGYLSPSLLAADGELPLVRPDGGHSMLVQQPESESESESGGQETAIGASDLPVPRIGGLARLSSVLVQQDIETVVLAFRQADRGDFFGALDTCHEHGVAAKVHREYADSVLVSPSDADELVDIDIEPWDPLDHLFKRVFDVAFATVGIVVFVPLLVVIAMAVKLDSTGPVLYSQDRTAGFGSTFPVYKFRSMVPEGEDTTPTTDGENDRITRVGAVLRKTHLDELPQLWSIFTGQMSVVGPRAVWTKEEELLEAGQPTWRKRWFVKPGLTGLAQVNDANSTDPNLKLRYDLQYIRQQSLWFDLKIVLRQIWMVLTDVSGLLRGRDPEESSLDE